MICEARNATMGTSSTNLIVDWLRLMTHPSELMRTGVKVRGLWAIQVTSDSPWNTICCWRLSRLSAGLFLRQPPVLGNPPVASHRACGAMCVVAGLQESELYVSSVGDVNGDVMGIAPLLQVHIHLHIACCSC